MELDPIFVCHIDFLKKDQLENVSLVFSLQGP